MAARLLPNPVTRYLAIAVGIAAVLAVILAAMGRVWWCKCGSPVPWWWQMNTSHGSQHLIDPYTFSHIQHGLLFYWGMWWLWRPRSDSPTSSASASLWRWTAALLIEAVWEVVENTPVIIERYRTATISLDYYGDSIANSLGDLAAAALGIWIAQRVGWRWGLGLYIVIELGMILTIRDSLLLNILMLVWPLEAIKQWQTR